MLLLVHNEEGLILKKVSGLFLTSLMNTYSDDMMNI